MLTSMIITVKDVLSSEYWNWTFSFPVDCSGMASLGTTISSKFKSCMTTGLSGRPIPPGLCEQKGNIEHCLTNIISELHCIPFLRMSRSKTYENDLARDRVKSETRYNFYENRTVL